MKGTDAYYSNVNQAHNDGRSPLWKASADGNEAMVKVLIKAGGNVNQHRNQDVTPLFMASVYTIYYIFHYLSTF